MPLLKDQEQIHFCQITRSITKFGTLTSVELSEAEVHWRKFPESLSKRGLHGVEVITSRFFLTSVSFVQLMISNQGFKIQYYPLIKMPILQTGKYFLPVFQQKIRTGVIDNCFT